MSPCKEDSCGCCPIGSPENDPEHPYNRPYVHGDDQGISKNRSCTDVICLLLFLVFLGGWGFVAFIGFRQGNIDKVLHPTDSNGQICGIGELKDRPHLLFFDLSKCLNPAVISLGCPTVQNCVEACPKVTKNLDNQKYDDVKQFCLPSADTNGKSMKELIDEEICPPYIIESISLLGRCFPNKDLFKSDEEVGGRPIKDLEKGIKKLSIFLNFGAFAERVFGTLQKTWWLIAVGLIIATILALLWVVLLRFITGIMVWFTLGCCLIVFGAGFGFSLQYYIKYQNVLSDKGLFEVNITPDYFQSNDFEDPGVLELKSTWLAFVIISGILFGIALLIFVALRQRIQLAIGLIKEGAKASGQICSSMFFPLVPFILHILVFAWFLTVALCLNSAGEKIYKIHYDYELPVSTMMTNQFNESVPLPPNKGCENQQGKQYLLNDNCIPKEFNDTYISNNLCKGISCQFTKYEKLGGGPFTNWMTWYNLFGFFWLMEFVTAFGEMVLAGVFAAWYWTRDKNAMACPLGSSFCRTFYHIGTIAFGSLIIGIIRFVRWVIDYLDKKMKGFDNDVIRCFRKCCTCCLWCLEKFMKFVNRNIYIMTAIKGTNFCKSGKDAFNLLMRNIARVVVLNCVVGFVLFIGKLVIMAGTGALSYFVLTGWIKELNQVVPNDLKEYVIIPIGVIVIGAYFITSSFFNVYSMAVDTLFLCFLEDLERNGPNGPYFMPKSILKIIGKMEQYNQARDRHRDGVDGVPLEPLMKS